MANGSSVLHLRYSLNATTPAPTNSRLESLPRELRDIIYYELWKLTPRITAKHKGIDLQILLRSQSNNQALKQVASRASALPAWLRTCKLIFHEGLDTLQHWSSWTVGPYHTSLPSISPSSTTGSSVLNPTAAGKLTIWADSLEHESWRAPGAMFALGNSNMRYIDEVARRLDISNTVHTLRLKTEVQLCCKMCFTGHEETGWHLDLSHIERLVSRLDLFEVEIRFFLSPFLNPVIDRSTCRFSFAEEVKRVGRLWVGERGALTTEVTSGAEVPYESVLYKFCATSE